MESFRFVNYPSTRGRGITVVADDPEHSLWLEVETILRGCELANGYVEESWSGALWFNEGTAAAVGHGTSLAPPLETSWPILKRGAWKNSCAPLKYGFSPLQRAGSEVRRVRRSPT